MRSAVGNTDCCVVHVVMLLLLLLVGGCSVNGDGVMDLVFGNSFGDEDGSRDIGHVYIIFGMTVQ